LESTEWEKSNYASTLLHHKADCMGPVIVDTLVNAVGCGTQNMPVPVLISTITKFLSGTRKVLHIKTFDWEL